MSEQDKIVLQIDLNGPTTRLIIGLPPASWEHLRRGEATTFDLTGMSLPLVVVLTGGANQAEVVAAVATATAAAG